MQLPKIYFRADGDPYIGLGHISRSLALAEMLKGHFHLVFLTRAVPASLKNAIHSICDEIIDLPQSTFDEEAELLAAQYLGPGDIVVLDGYEFSGDYQKTLKKNQIILIDDGLADHLLADLVINHAGGVSLSDYKLPPYSVALLGPHYALMRSPFIEASIKSRQLNAIDQIFVCFGGADPLKLTFKVLEALEMVDFIETVHVVTGAAFQELPGLKKLYRNLSKKNYPLPGPKPPSNGGNYGKMSNCSSTFQ